MNSGRPRTEQINIIITVLINISYKKKLTITTMMIIMKVRLIQTHKAIR